MSKKSKSKPIIASEAAATPKPKAPPVDPKPDDRVLLEGPHSRTREMRLLLHVVKDFVQGFRTLHFCGPCVTVFGSARVPEDHPYYQLGVELGKGSRASALR